jgi:hypothetical protein
MQRAPPLVQQAAVGHLVGQSVLEGILMGGKEPYLVQQFCRLEQRQATMQDVLGQLGNGMQQWQGHLGANHGSRLQEPLLLGR